MEHVISQIGNVGKKWSKPSYFSEMITAVGQNISHVVKHNCLWRHSKTTPRVVMVKKV